MTNKEGFQSLWRMFVIIFSFMSLKKKIQALEQMQEEILEGLDK